MFSQFTNVIQVCRHKVTVVLPRFFLKVCLSKIYDSVPGYPYQYTWMFISVDDLTLFRFSSCSKAALTARFAPKFAQKNSFAQSISTHYSCFENMGQFVTL